MEYRSNFILSMFSGIFTILIQYYLWTAIFSNSKSPTVYGYTYIQMITYTLLAGLISKIVGAGFESNIADDIKNGGLSKFIVQPMGYILFRVSNFLGGKTIFFGVALMIISVILIILKTAQGLTISYIRIAAFLVVLLFAIILNGLIFFNISTVAFWVLESSHLFAIAGFIINIFSGGLFPLDIFGPVISNILRYMPFQYIIYFPINVINGKMSLSLVIEGLAIQCIWIALFGIFARVFWNSGMKRYTAAGG